MIKFLKDQKEDKKCPKCKSDLLFMYGNGWDYDRALCSNTKCDYEIEYRTTTYPKSKSRNANNK